MRTALSRIGILTGGGDAPGLNAVIRAIVRAAHPFGIECVGLIDGFDGLARPDRARVLSWSDTSGIHRLGGTILGTTNHGCPLGTRAEADADDDSYARRCLDGAAKLALHAVVAIGGDGTLTIADALSRRGLSIVGVPKTIDNDIAETEMTFGFDSAVSFATDAIDRLHTTAEAHHRVMVVEVMGRYAGWIALYAALAGGADFALIPEIPFRLDRIEARIRERDCLGARSSIVVAAEGAAPAGGSRVVTAAAADGRAERLGGIGARVAASLEQATGHEARFDVLGHLQRGGPPSSPDRILAARFGVRAVDLIRRGEFGVMVALRSNHLVSVALANVAGRTRPVPVDGSLVYAARATGISFGD